MVEIFDADEPTEKPKFSDWESAALKAAKLDDLSALNSDIGEEFFVKPLYSEENPHNLAKRPESEFKGAWDIRPEIEMLDEAKANKIILTELLGGANSFELNILKMDHTNFAALLENVELSAATLAFSPSTNNIFNAQHLLDSIQNPQNARIDFNFDAFSYEEPQFDMKGIDEAFQFYSQKQNLLNAHFFAIDGANILENGASRTLEAACLIAGGIEWLREGDSRGFDIEKINSALIFKTGVGHNVVAEISKLRALRILWKMVGKHLGKELPMMLHGSVLRKLIRLEDTQANIMRIANACFAAACGNCDIITTHSFEYGADKESEFTRRLSLNTQNILKFESRLGTVFDPAAGAYAFEALSGEIAKVAFSYVQQFEAEGGLTNALKSGMVYDLVERLRK